MRITVLHFFQMQQMPAGLQRSYHDIVGFPDKQSADQRQVGGKLAVIADRIVGRQIVFLTGEIIIKAMRRRSVHQAGARFQRDMAATNYRHATVIKWMLQRQSFQRRSHAGCRDSVAPVIASGQLISGQA